MFGKDGGSFMKKKLIVEGMHCEHCAARVQKALLALDAEAKVEVHLKKKSVVISSKQALQDTEIRDAVTAIGFGVVEMK